MTVKEHEAYKKRREDTLNHIVCTTSPIITKEQLEMLQDKSNVSIKKNRAKS